MDTTIKDAILKCRSFSEGKKILETHGLGNNASATELLRTAIQIEKAQPELAKQFKETVADDIEKKKEEDKDVTESDGGTSHSSTTTGQLPTVGKEEPAQSMEGMDKRVNTHDQMGVSVNETHMMPGQVPPQQIPPQVPQQQMGQMPPQQQPQMPQQMQYTVMQEIAKIQEAIKKLDSDIRDVKETQNGPMTLELGNKIEPRHNGPIDIYAIQETKHMSPLNQDGIKSKYAKLQEDRNEICKLNSYFEATKKTPGVQ